MEMTIEESGRFLRECMGETLFEAEFGEYFRSEGLVSTTTNKSTSRPSNDLGVLKLAPPAPSSTCGSSAGQRCNGAMVNGRDQPFRNQEGFGASGYRRKNDTGRTGFSSSTGFSGTSNSGIGFSGRRHSVTGDSQQCSAFEPKFTILVPISNCGKVIGKGGTNIKRLEDDYNVSRLHFIRDRESDGFKFLVVQTTREEMDKAIDCMMDIIDLVTIEVDGRYALHLSGADVVKRVERCRDRLEAAGVPEPSSMSDDVTTLDADSVERVAEVLKTYLTILYGSAK